MGAPGFCPPRPGGRGPPGRAAGRVPEPLSPPAAVPSAPQLFQRRRHGSVSASVPQRRGARHSCLWGWGALPKPTRGDARAGDVPCPREGPCGALAGSGEARWGEPGACPGGEQEVRACCHLPGPVLGKRVMLCGPRFPVCPVPRCDGRGEEGEGMRPSR